ncbi:MAG: hypothetical protein PHU66_09440 [Bacteroidaceae bacterium]|nr:hypothetical protein [Bacteroidaceae bacterium]
MAIIVKHKKNNEVYVLVGASYSHFKDSRPGFLGGSLVPHKEEGVSQMAAIANENGEIFCCPINDIKVLMINGENIKNLIVDFKSLHSDLLEE